MSSINDYNYEAYFLDYLEGNLSQEQVTQLLLFLDKHPYLKEELEEMDMVTLEAPEEIPFDSSSLKKTINEGNVDDYVIASLENDIHPEDQEELTAYLATSKKARNTAALYQKTLLPPEVISYPNKERLKKRGAVVYYLGAATTLAAAAVVTLLILFSRPEQEPSSIAASQRTTPETARDNSGEVVANSEREFEESRKDSSVTKSKIITQTSLPTTKIKKGNVEVAASDIQVENDVIETSLLPSLSAENPETIEAVLVQEETPLPIEQKVDPKAPFDLPDITPTPEVEDNLPPTENIAVNAKAPSSGEPLRISQWINQKIRSKILRQTDPGTEKIESEEVFAAVVERIDEKENSQAHYRNDAKSNRKTYSISIGKFEFSRSVAK